MDKVKQLNNFTLYDDNALGLILRGATLSEKICTIVQPALMTARKPESFGMTPGVATMNLTADNEVNGYAKNVYISSLHPGTNRTGQVKAGKVAPAPTIMGTKKRGSQMRLLPHNDNRKARRTHTSQTRDTMLGRDIYDEDQSTNSPNGLTHHDTSTGVIEQDRVTS